MATWKEFAGVVLIGTALILLGGCESENEHFCAKYSYYYRELTRPGIMPLKNIEAQLLAELRSGDRDPDKTKIALFVLDDVADGVKPAGEEAQDYCMRLKLWERYH